MSDSHISAGSRDAGRQGQASARRVLDEAPDAMPAFGDAARAAGDAIRTGGRKASTVMADLTDEVRDTGMKAREQVASQVQAQPMASVLIAAAVGLIAGLLLSRR